MSNFGYANQISTGYSNRPKSVSSIKRVRRKEEKPMKLTLKQRIRNWLMDESSLGEVLVKEEPSGLSSDGMRFEVYKASGGFVVETRYYDRRSDMHNNKLYVITEDKDLGAELGKIITMESMR